MVNAKLGIAGILIVVFSFGVIVGAKLFNNAASSTSVPATEANVTGIGGIFFKVDDPEVSRQWYREHLGIAGDGPGVNFFWLEQENPENLGFTVWSIFSKDTEYFGSDDQEFMINYRVRNLDALLARLSAQGVQQAREIEEYSYGRFAWIIDGDGRQIELWEPIYAIPESI